MPRKPRFYAPGIVHHVAQFAPDQTSCFRQDRDYSQCLRFLRDASFDYDCRIHAYALLPSGLHLILAPTDEYGIPRFMQSLARRYVSYLNQAYHRSGSLWTHRFKASAIDAATCLIPVSQYIEFRPVHLGYVAKPQDYRWSSYRNNALGISDGITSHHQAYLELGVDSTRRHRSYKRVADKPQKPSVLREIERCLTLGVPLGSSQFKQELAKILNVLPITLYPRRSFKRDGPQGRHDREYPEPA